MLASVRKTSAIRLRNVRRLKPTYATYNAVLEVNKLLKMKLTLASVVNQSTIIGQNAVATLTRRHTFASWLFLWSTEISWSLRAIEFWRNCFHHWKLLAIMSSKCQNGVCVEANQMQWRTWLHQHNMHVGLIAACRYDKQLTAGSGITTAQSK